MNRSELIAELFETMDIAKRSMHGHMQTVVEGHAISRTQLELLFTIYHLQPTTAKNLAAKLHLTPGAISQLVEELMEQSLIQRETDPSDRRKQVISLTAEGSAVIKTFEKRRHGVMNKVIENLSDEELVTWLKIQKHIIAIFNEMHPEKEQKTQESKEERN
jgi:DNA-binding MarR family transcriptional regulator